MGRAAVVMLARESNYDENMHNILRDIVPDVVPSQFLDRLILVDEIGGKLRYMPSDLPEIIDLNDLGSLFRMLNLQQSIVRVEVVIDLGSVRTAVEKETAILINSY